MSAGALDGKAVVVTGAARGLGAAYVSACAAAGASVVACDVDADELARTVTGVSETGAAVVAHPADVSDWSAADGVIRRCVDEFGRIDGLVNNAGLMWMSWPQEQREQPAREMIESNLVGTLACGTAALRLMAGQGSGSIVNVTSGTQMGASALAVYGATKAAVASLTYSWSIDLARAGVRVNAISPNAHTRMADEARRFGTALGAQNIGIPPEVNAPLVVYLLSDLSRSITGQVIRINGDELMVCAHPANLEPLLRREKWSVGAIDEAFRERLGGVLQPPGARTVRVASGGGPGRDSPGRGPGRGGPANDGAASDMTGDDAAGEPSGGAGAAQ